MALNPNIILAGQAPDIMGALATSNQAAQQRLEFDNQNALRAMMREQGPGIMAGDPNALNALAQFDPRLALGVQSDRLGLDAARQDMAFTSKKMAALDTATQREAEAYAKSISAEQAAAEAAALEASVKQALMAPTPEAFDALMVQSGQPELVGQFENREMLGAQFMSVAEILKQSQGPEWVAATPEQAAQYGATAGQINNQTGQFQKTGDGNGVTQTITNPDGTTTTIQVGGAARTGTGKPPTEAQSKDNVFFTRASGALEALEGPMDPNNPQSPALADALADLGQNTAERIPLVGNYMLTEAYQTARTAGDEYLQAILRKDTGAAITAPEQQLYGVTYLPQPGDGPRRLAYKREARARAVEAIAAGMTPEQMEAKARADAAILARLGEDGAPPPAAPQQPAAGTRRLKFNPETGELE